MTPWSKMLRRDVDDDDLESAWQHIRSRRKRPRRAVRRAMIAVPAALLAVLLFVTLRGWYPAASGPTASSSTPTPVVLALAGGARLPAEWSTSKAESVSFDEGSRMELAPGTSLQTKENRAASGELAAPGTKASIEDKAIGRIELALQSGRATFDVKPGGTRAWIIDAGDVVVRVLGTRFTVSRDERRVEVSVERGKVRVESSRIETGARVLGAGESIAIDDARADAMPSEAKAADDEPANKKLDDGGSPSPLKARVSGRPTVASQAENAAAGSIAESPPVETKKTDAMSEADAARREGRPRDAARLLEALVDAHDARAPLAAFTLGKIHAEDLGDHAKAALWFERAVALGLPAGLDEEALARAVDSYARAGQRGEAKRAAGRYESKYPSGRHKDRVQGWARD